MPEESTPKQAPKIDPATYNQLIIRKKLAQRQLQNIKSLTYHELLDKTRKREEVMPPSPTVNYYKQAMVQILKDKGFEGDLDSVVKRHMDIQEYADKNNTMIRKQMRQMPIFSQIKRGKLGFDSVLILFAIIGSVALPAIFYQKFKKNKQIIISSRKYKPEIIENISDDSPIDIDEVSEKSIHYDNPDRRRLFEKKMVEAEKISQLRRDLDL